MELRGGREPHRRGRCRRGVDRVAGQVDAGGGEAPGRHEVDGGLAGAGTVTTNALAGNLNVGANNADNVFAGTLAEASGFALSLTKVGTGTQTFAGTNTNTGTLTVNSGTVVLAGTGTWSGLTLSGGNSYGGDTSVSAGTLSLGAANVIPNGAGKGNVAGLLVDRLADAGQSYDFLVRVAGPNAGHTTYSREDAPCGRKPFALRCL